MTVASCLFVGFWAFVFQGYVEDAGMRPVQSWPVGVTSFALAGLLTTVAIRRARPGLKAHHVALIVVGVSLALVAAAVGAIDAGNP